jgi:hypothetical protein
MPNGQAQPIAPSPATPGLPPYPTGADYFNLYRMLAGQGSTQGLTQMAPQVPRVQVPQPQPRPEQYSGPGLSGGMRGGAMVGNIIQSIGQKYAKQQADQLQADIDRFTQAISGVSDAQGMMQEAQQANQQAMQEFQQAQTPEAKQQASFNMRKAAMRLQEAQKSLQSNRMLLQVMFEGSRGNKLRKTLEKAVGFDPKTAQSPEHQALRRSIEERTGVRGPAANIMSRMPQTMQLSPEARQRQMLGMMGGKPPTGGELLRYQTAEERNRLQRQQTLDMLTRIEPSLRAVGKTFDRDQNGEIKFGPSGQPLIRMMTKEEVEVTRQMKPGGPKPLKPEISNGMVVGVSDPNIGKLYTSKEGAPEEVQKVFRDVGRQLDLAFNRRLELQTSAFTNALIRSDYTAAHRELMKTQSTVDDAIDRAAVMDKNLVDVLAGNQQAMLSLLSNHIGMTLGLQKGARITQTAGNEAVATAPWLGRIAAHFGADGYLSGVVLTPEQARQMVDLAHDRLEVLKDRLERVKSEYSDELAVKPTTRKTVPAPPPRRSPTTGQTPIVVRPEDMPK